MRPPLVLLALFLSVSILTTAALAAIVGPQPATAAAEDPTVRELAERLLAPSYGGPYGPQITAKLYPGKLPDGVSLPLPANARLVGSVARTAIGGNPGQKYFGPSTEIVLDVPGETHEAFEAVRAALTAGGWTSPQMPQMQPHGFQPSQATASGGFCKATSWLNVSVAGNAGATRDVRMQLNNTEPGMGGPCSQAQGPAMSKPMPPGFDKLPALYAPKGMTLMPIGGPSGPNRWSSEAIADSTLAPHELDAIFAKQLVAAGWTLTDRHDDGRLTWSAWKVDATWSGFLFVLESSSGKRELSVRVIGQ